MINWIIEDIGTSQFEVIKDIKDVKIIDVRNLVDKRGNMEIYLTEKINAGLRFLDEGNKIIIACDYGISRSNSIAAAIISKSKNISFIDAIKMVIMKTGIKDLNLSIINDLYKILNEKTIYKEKKSRSENILITGSSGFIGRSLVQSLKKDFEIFTPSHKEIDLLQDLLMLDLFIKEKNIDTIIHLANPKIYTTNQAMGDSLIMLKNVIDVCIENDVKLIFPSSWVIYSAYQSEELLASETLPKNPKDSYGFSKYFGEKLIKDYGKDLNYLILRFSPVYGGGNQPKFIYNFIEKAMNNEEIITHKYLNGFPKLDLIHVNDVIILFNKILAIDLRGTFNIGTQKGVSTSKVAEIIIEILKSKSIITNQMIDDYAPNIIMDIHKISSLTDWRPTIELREGLRLLINKIKESKN